MRLQVRKQAQGISQTNSGLSQVDSVTQQNTANAEQTASAAQEMTSLSIVLHNLVAHFKLTEAKSEKSKGERKRKSRSRQLEMPAARKGRTAFAAPAPETIVTPKEQIILDDDEFGKF